METEPLKGALARKLAKILGEIGKVPKSGRNDFHGYDYVTENDLVYAVRDKLSAASVFVFSSVESQHVEIITSKNREGQETSTALTTVTTKHTFVDGDSGEEFSVLSQGQGADNGDKGGYKAITGAMKYFLYKCFMIPTGDDPEGDDKTDARVAGGTTSSTKTQTSSSKPAPSVPRDAEVDDVAKRQEKFTDNKWQSVEIHFGKQKGHKLVSLEAKSLQWWINDWYPKPYNGKFDQRDLDLRAALNVANLEWK